MSLCNLGIAITMRFISEEGKLEDIDDSISLHREGLALRPSPHPGRPDSLSGLANSLDSRFRRTNQLVDINEAISLLREALELLPADHPDRSASLNNLGDALANKFHQLGDSSVLEEAISTSRAAVQCESAPTSQRFFAALLWAHNADPHHESAIQAYQSAIELLNRLAMFSSDIQSRQQAYVYEAKVWPAMPLPVPFDAACSEKLLNYSKQAVQSFGPRHCNSVPHWMNSSMLRQSFCGSCRTSHMPSSRLHFEMSQESRLIPRKE